MYCIEGLQNQTSQSETIIITEVTHLLQVQPSKVGVFSDAASTFPQVQLLQQCMEQGGRQGVLLGLQGRNAASQEQETP